MAQYELDTARYAQVKASLNRLSGVETSNQAWHYLYRNHLAASNAEDYYLNFDPNKLNQHGSY